MPFVASFLLTGLTGQILSFNMELLFVCLMIMSVSLWIISIIFLKVYEEESAENLI